MRLKLDIILVRLWTLDSERIRASLRAAGLSARITRVDFSASLHAALTRSRFDAAIYDPSTPRLSLATVGSILREHRQQIPIVILGREDEVGSQLAIALRRLEN
jgi:DNA-binding response OmpR family regulator